MKTKNLFHLILLVSIQSAEATKSYKPLVVVSRAKSPTGDAYVNGNWQTQRIKTKYDYDALQKGIIEYADNRKLNEIQKKEHYAQLHFYKANVAYQNLDTVKLPNLSMNQVNANHAKLTSQTFVDPKLKDVQMSDADLSKSKFMNGSIRNVSLKRANLENTQLIGNVRFTDFTDANMRGAILGGRFMTALFKGANLSGVTLLPNTDMRGAESFKMPMADLIKAKDDGCKFDAATEAKIKFAKGWVAFKNLMR